jgi:hypothetical protein
MPATPTPLPSVPAIDLDRLANLVQAYANLVAMQNNILANVQIIQIANSRGTLKVPVAQAYNDLGLAFQQRLAMIQDVLDANAGGIDPNDITTLQGFLSDTVAVLAGTTITDPTEVDTLVADVNATVPVTTNPFVSALTVVSPPSPVPLTP